MVCYMYTQVLSHVQLLQLFESFQSVLSATCCAEDGLMTPTPPEAAIARLDTVQLSRAEISYGDGQRLTLESGEIGRLAGGSVMLQARERMHVCLCVACVAHRCCAACCNHVAVQ
jgi:hypothetical protein